MATFSFTTKIEKSLKPTCIELPNPPPGLKALTHPPALPLMYIIAWILCNTKGPEGGWDSRCRIGEMIKWKFFHEPHDLWCSTFATSILYLSCRREVKQSKVLPRCKFKQMNNIPIRGPFSRFRFSHIDKGLFTWEECPYPVVMTSMLLNSMYEELSSHQHDQNLWKHKWTINTIWAWKQYYEVSESETWCFNEI